MQTNDNIMWLHKTYETGINIKSKDYKKGMSYIINLTLQLKQLDNERKNITNLKLVLEKKIIENRTEKKKKETIANINNTKRRH